MVAALAVVLLSACGNAFQLPAAVVGGMPITQEALAHQLQVLLADPQYEAQVRGPGGAEARRDLTRRLLGLLVRRQIVDDYARRRGIAISPGDVDRQLGSIIRGTGGLARFRQILRQRGLTEEDVRDNIFQSQLLQRVHDAVAFDRVGPNATGRQADRAFATWLGEQLRAVDVQVNPRFGRFDRSNGAICPVASTADTASCPGP